MGDTIVPYYGNILFTPTPLELSFNRCSHSCLYCFANLNTPDRVADVKHTLSMIRNFRKRDTIEARFMKLGYPILVSNRVDPFAKSNYRQSLPILKMMIKLGIRIDIQTKGGDGDIEIAEMLIEHGYPSHWYITVTHDSDETRKKIEPGAPSIEYRHNLIKRLHDMGHIVSVGINPIVRDWFSDYKKQIKIMNGLGVSGYWLYPLAFSPLQYRVLPRKDIVTMGVANVEMARSTSKETAPDDYANEVAEYIISTGVSVFRTNVSEKTHYFDRYKKVYGKLLPINQDFINWLWDNKREGDLITFDDYWSVLSGFPEGDDWQTQSYFRVSRRLDFMRGKENFPRRSSFKELAKHFWKNPQYTVSPVNIDNLAYAVDKKEKPIFHNGLPVMVYAGNENYWEHLYQMV